jgi:preprotein translocase subunit YajC
MISVAHAQAVAPVGVESFSGDSLLFPIAVFIGFWFLILRPQSKRQKEHQALTDSIKVGDEVVMTGGMMGKIIRLTDQYVVLDVNVGTELKFQRSAIAKALPKDTLKLI